MGCCISLCFGSKNESNDTSTKAFSGQVKSKWDFEECLIAYDNYFKMNKNLMFSCFEKWHI